MAQVFINASTSDVVATTSMEALAMGKWLICADHPCNHFVANFHNCLIYHSPAEFCRHLDHALSHDPAPLSPATLRRALVSPSRLCREAAGMFTYMQNKGVDVGHLAMAFLCM